MTRLDRLNALLDEHGCATNCEMPKTGYVGYMARYALMEADEGAADNGGPWWNLGDNPGELVESSINQEYAGDWPPTLLVDLDTGKVLDWEVKIVVGETGEVIS